MRRWLPAVQHVCVPLHAVNVPDAGSQFRSRDVFPPAVAGLVRGEQGCGLLDVAPDGSIRVWQLGIIDSPDEVPTSEANPLNAITSSRTLIARATRRGTKAWSRACNGQTSAIRNNEKATGAMTASAM